LGLAYAVRTPTWQNPDEPAHFNYVRHIGEGDGLPVLREGDYNQAYLSELTSAKFPPDMPVDSLRYESHQPPLYYALASPLYAVFSGAGERTQVLALRAFSVFLGVLLLVAAFALTRALFPRSGLLALAVPGFIALLPQHAAMSAAVNNDTLGELLVTVVLLLLVLALRRRPEMVPSWRAAASPAVFLLGVTLALVLLTKTTAYAVFGAVGVAYGWRWLWHRRAGGQLARELALLMLITVLLSGWWFGRNMATYGATDPAGLERHDQVVAEQPRTGDFDAAAAKRFVRVGFKSFWAQLGWMAVPADDRLYPLLGLVTGGAALGLVLAGVGSRRAAPDFALTKEQWAGLSLLAVTLVLVFLEWFGYNLRYIQTQGRYLFPAIAPIGVFFALGMRRLLGWPSRVPLFVALYAGLFAVDLYVLLRLVPQL